jgi:hypothetical protein
MVDQHEGGVGQIDHEAGHAQAADQHHGQEMAVAQQQGIARERA